MGRWDITGSVIMKKIFKVCLCVLFLLPITAAFPQDKGAFDYSKDYHYISYGVGQIWGEGNCLVEFYSNAVVVNFYRRNTQRSQIDHSRTFYYQQNSNGKTIYVEPSNMSTYSILEYYGKDNIEVYMIDPGNFFFGKSLSYKLTPGIIEREYYIFDQPSNPVPVATPTNTNVNPTTTSSPTQSSTPTQHKCGVCGGTGRVEYNDVTTYGSTGTKYCSECGKIVPMYHGHKPCQNCKGKGWW